MIYVLGRAKIAVSMGVHKDSNVPIIRLGKIEEGFEIGDSLLDKDVIETDVTHIAIENLEGLAVLEKAIKAAKKHLKKF